MRSNIFASYFPFPFFTMPKAMKAMKKAKKAAAPAPAMKAMKDVQVYCMHDET